ncbi:MAG TPA: hypothetical protein VG737_01225 [Cyclobacteriaceae bacterium]|nr:hypothetical protein [Cyclobacteriaceae bacterium]
MKTPIICGGLVKAMGLSLSIFPGLIFLLLMACEKPAHRESSQAKTPVKPDVDIKVDRLYDDKGNLIAFDSLYRALYSDTLKRKHQLDSLFESFHRSYLDKSPTLLEKPFNRLFFHDSLLYSDFFHKDFFQRRYELNDLYMRKMMHELDSIKNQHYKELSERHKIISKKPTP